MAGNSLSTTGTKINYLSRDFNAIRADLISWARLYHPDKFVFINDASPDVMYLELCAYVGDMLSYYTDKSFNESFLSTSQAGLSLTRIANDLGFFDLGPTPASTQVILSIKVPLYTDIITGEVSPNPDLLPAIKPGMLIKSDSGINFEILEELNFGDPFNRRIIPNLDANNQIIDYTVEKAVVAKAGETKIQRFFVTSELAKPFLTITLDDLDITEVVGLVATPGNQFTAPADEDFINPDKAWFEVRSLAEDLKFVELNPDQIVTSPTSNAIPTTIKQGTYIEISKRFISRRDVNGLVSLTFGSNAPSFSSFNSLIELSFVDPLTVSLNTVLQNTALGEIPPPNNTLFIKYRIKGGSASNVQTGQLNTIVAKNFYPASPSAVLTDLQNVRNSLKVRNEIPALGGKEAPSKEEIRATAGKLFAGQDRGVTYEDIKALIATMPPQFGRPFRVAYEEIKPRVSNFQQVENEVNTLLDSLLTETTAIGRQLKAQEISQFMTALREGPVTINGTTVESTLDSTSLALLGTTPTLWIGEKARLYLLGIDENNQLLSAYKDVNGLWVSSNELLKQNIREYLSTKRIIGDWIDIVDAHIVNIQVEFTVLVDKRNKQQVLVDCLNKLRDYFKINNWQINQPIFKSNVSTVLQEINGVANVVDLKIFNIFGTGYNSVDPVSGRVYAPFETGRYKNNSTTSVSPANNKFEMLAPNNVIISYPTDIFEVKYPESDIIARAI